MFWTSDTDFWLYWDRFKKFKSDKNFKKNNNNNSNSNKFLKEKIFSRQKKNFKTENRRKKLDII